MIDDIPLYWRSGFLSFSFFLNVINVRDVNVYVSVNVQ